MGRIKETSRKSSNRRRRSVIYIICEGTETEPWFPSSISRLSAQCSAVYNLLPIFSISRISSGDAGSMPFSLTISATASTSGKFVFAMVEGFK